MEMQRQQRILIVDNDERVLRVMDGFLANAGFDTKTASDGHSALDLLKVQDVILCLWPITFPTFPSMDSLRPGTDFSCHRR
jgi:CheY-like chemotaxis protein